MAPVRTEPPLSVCSILEEAVRANDPLSLPPPPDEGRSRDATSGRQSCARPDICEAQPACFETLEYVGEPDDRLVCPICKCYMVAPSVITPCGHAYCHACLHRHLDSSNTCPMDRRRVMKSDVKPSAELADLLDRAQVWCPHAPRGCEAKVERARLIKHVTSCKFSEPKRFA